MGAGSSFCAGADLTSLDDPQRQHELRADGGGAGPMGPSRLALNKPLIAAIEGYAVAGGLELALLADLRVAADNAVLGVFCRRWGVPLIDGGTVRLPRVVDMGHAMDMILTGRPGRTRGPVNGFGQPGDCGRPGLAGRAKFGSPGGVFSPTVPVGGSPFGACAVGHVCWRRASL
jgi:hypothetical protein